MSPDPLGYSQSRMAAIVGRATEEQARLMRRDLWLPTQHQHSVADDVSKPSDLAYQAARYEWRDGWWRFEGVG